MNKFKILVLIILINSSNLKCQEIEGSWLFNNQETFITEIEGKIGSDIFDFFNGYTISNDTLKIKHVYPKNECSSLDENGKPVWIPCTDFVTTNSWYKINKFTSDSLILNPINRSAIAVSAWLKNRPHNETKKIISDSSYTPSYFQTIKLYNSKILFEEISWSKIRISSKSNGWFQEHYEYLEINSDGTFKAFKKVKPFEEGKPRKEYISKDFFYEDTLSENQFNELNSDLRKSGFFHFNIDSKGCSSHGSLIKIQIFDDNKTKTHIGYGHKYPKFALPLINRLLNIVNEKETNQTETQFDIPIDFINDGKK
ncbi:hypothetical protein Q4Q35_07335 [Flavivirga aquimarina]|uniref:Uncharacterized protein n=1 Tax=Flavivirga aquimarina TaxID=2027862 RepID=A0ABT8W930_9FLAO|nr:hypothetical protein [Flavivirga aquimarina]MDO5969615.1 hypothetical protein [Flavivirga aquimarina]